MFVSLLVDFKILITDCITGKSENLQISQSVKKGGSIGTNYPDGEISTARRRRRFFEDQNAPATPPLLFR